MNRDISVGPTNDHPNSTVSTAEAHLPLSPPLARRGTALSTVDRLLHGAANGHGGGAYLIGGPGSGKTRLLNEIALRSQHDVTVLRSSGTWTERTIPFAGLHQLLYPLRADAKSLPPQHSATLERVFSLSEPITDWVPVSCATLALLEVASARSPLLLLVDNAHRFDDATLDILAFASRRLQNMPVTMVIAALNAEPTLNRLRGLPNICLEPLSSKDIQRLLITVVGSTSQATVDRLSRESGGNPLVVTELATTLTSAAARGDDELPEELPTSLRLHASFDDAVAALPASSRRLLLVAAANDEADVYSTLAAAASLGLDIADLTAAERFALITVAGDKLVFQPPLLRSILYRNATFAERRSIHHALAHATANSPHRQARHLFAATYEPDDELARKMRAHAGYERQVKGITLALRSLERAAILSRDPTTRSRMLSDAASCAWQAGLPVRAQTLEKQISGSDSDPHLAAATTLLRAAIAYTEATSSAAHRILLDSTAQADLTDPTLTAQLLVLAARSAISRGDSTGLTQICQRVSDLAFDADHPVNLFAAAMGRLVERDLRASGALDEAAVAMLRTLSATQPTVWPAVVPYVPTMGHAAHEAYVHAVAELRQQGATGMLPLAGTSLLAIHIVAGRWDEATDLGEELLLLTKRTGQRAMAARVRATLAFLAGSRGDSERCQAWAGRTLHDAARSGDLAAVTTARWGLGRAALSVSDLHTALPHLSRVVSKPEGAVSGLVALLAAPDLVECHVRVGQANEAVETLRAAEDWRVDESAPHVLGPLRRARALLTSSPEEAERLLTEAITLCRDNPFERGRGELQLGKLLRRERRIKKARRLLHTAIATFESLSATAWVAEAEAELRATGFDHPTDGHSAHGQIALLTPQERRITQLASQGLTNPEIGLRLSISSSTIRYHLSKVFQKLEISSRRQLLHSHLFPDADETAATPNDPATHSGQSGVAQANGDPETE